MVRADYGEFTAAKHRQMLIDDFLRPDREDRRTGAYLRLALYYPDEVERLVLKQLQVPTYDVSLVYKFVTEKLRRKESPAERKALLDAFVKTNSPACRDGVLLELFQALGLQEEDEQGRSSSPSPYKLDARSALVQLYGYGEGVTGKDVPYVNTWHLAARMRFIESLTHDKSKRIGDAVKDLYLKSMRDPYTAPACLRCLASRGYDVMALPGPAAWRREAARP